MNKYRVIDQFWIDEDQHIRAVRFNHTPNWYVQYNLPGKGQRRKSLGTPKKKLAEKLGRQFARQFADGQVTGEKPRNPTIEQACQARLNWLNSRGRAAGTLEIYGRYHRQLQAWCAAHHVYRLMDLTVVRLEAFEAVLRKGGLVVPCSDGKPSYSTRPLGAKTLHSTMKEVRSVIRFALKRGMIDRDPSRGYELPPYGPGRIDVFSSAELALIYADPDLALGDIWQFLTHTCLRISELCWLLKEDVLVDERGRPVAIRIRRKTCPQTGQPWQPKHGVERTVPLSAQAAEIVERARRQSTVPWLFEAPDTIGAQSGRWTRYRLGNRLRARLQACGIDHGSPHVFRHTGATFLANDGQMNIVHLQKFLGHSQLAQTMRYVHAGDADVARSIGRVDFGRLSSSDAHQAAPDNGFHQRSA